MSNDVLSGITAGLKNTYSYLASQYPNGITLDNITKARNNSTNSINQSFASYLQSNFKQIDKDGDGVISSKEIDNLYNLISTQGLTKDELTQLYSSGGISESLMTKILEHFEDIDANHDGKITSAEISAYDVKCARMETEDNFNNRKATDMSVFYGGESSSEDTYNLLSYRYKNK